MNSASSALKDNASRRSAISEHGRSLLVEAGAGSGKTAIIAGRIASLLAAGVAPKSIAAVTFTELAASELLIRVREFVAELAAGKLPTELCVAFPKGLSDKEKASLAEASVEIDEVTCSTIHGFCQRLIKPYPVEANLDPGAGVIDSTQAELVFMEVVDKWLREELSRNDGSVLAEMVLREPEGTLKMVQQIAANLRRRRKISAPAMTPVEQLRHAFREAVNSFEDFVRTATVEEDETVEIVRRFAGMAQALDAVPSSETPPDLVQILVSLPHPDLCTKAGSFLAFQKKGRWADAAKHAGLSKADGERLFISAAAHYQACCNAWNTLLESTASRVLSELIEQLRPVQERFQDYKRSAALLDYDDLIVSARNLLRDHDEVRRALAACFSHVLVDEFQDTDPLQTEIFWRLCGEPTTEGAEEDWTTFRIRPGALFLVADPKQAIYRFRGADVTAYLRAREAFMAQDAESILSITTNFRSCSPILTYVNECFEAPLSSAGQPGFTVLDAFHEARPKGVCVAALDVIVADENGNASVEKQRDAEAKAVAEMCARLIGSEYIIDHHAGGSRRCRPGDIALLAPTGTDLWRYEEALERLGIPVATQAGKGLFRRQEIQDLIALTRVLADRRDTLALGALLRGPLVGLTEEALLDIIWALPRSEEDPEEIPRLDLGVNVDHIAHPLAKATIEKLQSLSRHRNSSTPHDVISQAIDVMRIRPILLQRHGGQAERALANVDLYLGLASAYSIRGLRAFAETMTAAWTDEERAVEGRPDAQEQAVALYTMHAAKGLEWPIVVPVNAMTGIMSADSAVTDRSSEIFYCPVLGVKPAGYNAVRDAEKAELERERIRLWYVAATRARELLILPRHDVIAARSTWISLVALSLADLPALEVAHLPQDIVQGTGTIVNEQTREAFAAQAETIANRQRRLTWLTPSRTEGLAPDPAPEAASVWVGGDDLHPVETAPSSDVQGGRERGLVLHKLLEEVLNGETADEIEVLTDRARSLIQALGRPVFDDASKGLSPAELARCVIRTLALPEINALRSNLTPEYNVYSSVDVDGVEHATTGIADAISTDSDGRLQVVIDWKSDVQATQEIIGHYCKQVRDYLDMTGAERGLIVFLTTGKILTVAPTPKTAAA